jgi:hypothetical protein
VLRHEIGGYHCGPVDAVRAGFGATAAVAEEARDGRQTELDGGVEDGPADLALVRVLERQPPLRHGLLVAGRVVLVGANQARRHAGKVARLRRARFPERRLDQLGFGLDVETGEGDGDVVAVTAPLVHGDFQRGRRRLAHRSRHPHAVAAE